MELRTCRHLILYCSSLRCVWLNMLKLTMNHIGLLRSYCKPNSPMLSAVFQKPRCAMKKSEVDRQGCTSHLQMIVMVRVRLRSVTSITIMTISGALLPSSTNLRPCCLHARRWRMLRGQKGACWLQVLCTSLARGASKLSPACPPLPSFR